MEDDARLDEPMDVQLVMLPMESGSGTSPDQLISSLVEAAADGELETIAQLLAAGADKDGQDGDGWTPLHAACRFGQKEVVTLLFDDVAHKDVEAENGETPLRCACDREHADIVELLLRAGADPDLSSPLIKADDLGNTEIVNLLLEYGADAECLRSLTPTPLSSPRDIHRYRSFGSGSSF